MVSRREARSFWQRLFGEPEELATSLGVIAQAAVRGEPLAKLLKISAEVVLARADADRAGVWVDQGNWTGVWEGYVVEKLGAAPDAWRALDTASQLPPEIWDSVNPFETDFFAFHGGARQLCDGMQAAIWLPLRVQGELLGVALAASSRRKAFPRREILSATAAEIALAMGQMRASLQLARADQGLRLRAELDRAIMAHATGAQFLERIVSSAARDTLAEFAGLTRPTNDALDWLAFSGSESKTVECRTVLLEVVNTALRESRPAIHSFLASPASRTPAAGEHCAPESPSMTVAALPLGDNGEIDAIFLAGFPGDAVIPVERLQEYAELALRARTAEARLGLAEMNRALFENSAVALMVLDAKGKIVEASPRAKEVLHLNAETAGRIELVDRAARAERESWQAWLSRAASSTAVPALEGTLASGFAVRLKLLKALSHSGRLLVALEKRGAAQNGAPLEKQMEAEMSSVLETVQAGVLLLDPSGRVRHANARLRMLLGLGGPVPGSFESFGELERLVAGNFRDRQAFGARWRTAAEGAGEAGRDELEMTRPARRILERHARPVLDEEGRRLGWMEVFWDITSRRSISSKLLQTEKMAALGQLVSGIAHELNNPLTGIMGYAQLLLGHGLDPVQLGEAKMIYQEAERARRIVKNLLFFARETKPERTRVDLNEIVERTLALRGYELKIENIIVDCDLAPDLPQTLADPHQIQQVILNLIVNAEQAILQSRGQGRIRIRTCRVAGQNLALEVSDDGPGIPRDVSLRIFDPFFTTKPPGLGTGLGLSIVYGIVQQHGGEVTFENQPGGGARFIVELPILAVPDAQTPREVAQPASLPASESATGRVLVVEDEPSVAKLIADVLGEEGHQVEAVLDSKEGLARIARAHYDLVICDFRMPRLAGPEFYDSLVRAGSPAQHRILFITGDLLSPRTLGFLQSRQLPYLAKPFLVEELKLAVNRMLEGRRSETHHAFARTPGGGGR